MIQPPAADRSANLQGAARLLQSSRELSARGRDVESAAALRRALDLAPTDVAVGAAIAQFAGVARTWLTLGQARLAVDALAPLAGSPHANGTLLMLYGHGLMGLGRKDEALAVFRRWREQDPHNREATLTLAAVLADTDHAQEAEALVRTTTSRSGASIQTSFVLGRALLEQARFDEAESEFRCVVQANPAHQIAQANLMELVWMRTGDVQAASRALDRALRAQPDLLGLRLTKARLLVSARQPREALAEIDLGLAKADRDPALLAAATTIALDFDGQRALGYAQRLSQVAQDRAARVALGNALLANGRAAEALEIAESLHESDPADGQALAMKADALRMLGNGRYRELLDYQRLVRAQFIDVPDGWNDLDAYLEELVDDIGRLHTSHAHPIGNSLRDGSQVRLLPGKSSSPSIRAFPVAIDGPIRRYMAAIGRGTDAMRCRNTGHYAISGIWSVRLRPNGFHVNHYHPQGWISSACYLHLPSALDRGGGEGWLKFGEPAFPTTPALEPEYFLKPASGLLALFPSYMWHGTVPFGGKQQDARLTIAFDVVPGS